MHVHACALFNDSILFQKPKPRAPPEVLVVLGGEWVKANEPPKEEEIKEKLIHYDALVYGNMEGSDSGHYKLTSLPEEYTNVWGYEACIVGQYELAGHE